MRCEWTFEDLSAYMDREVAPEQAERIRIHLAACPRCRRQVETFRQVGTLVRAVPEVGPPAGLRSRVVALDAALPVPSATCEQARAWLSQRADGELPHWQAPVLAQHLEGCEGCRREADAVQGMISLVQALPQVNPPLRIRAAVRNAMTRQAHVRRVWRMGWTSAGLAFAGAAAMLLVTLRPGMPPQPTNVAEVTAPAPSPEQPLVPVRPGVVAETPAAVAESAQTPAKPPTRVATVRRWAGAVARAFTPGPRERSSSAAVEAGAGSESLARAVAGTAVTIVAFTDPREAMTRASERYHVVASEAALATPPEEPAAVKPDSSADGNRSKHPEAEAALAEAKQALKERPFKGEVIRVERKQPVVHAEY